MILKTNRLLIVFTLCSTFLYSQKEECSTDLVIDFSELYHPQGDSVSFNNSILEGSKCYLKKGQYYNLNITNINLNVFKVESKLESKNLNTDKPEILSEFKLPSFLNFDLPESANDKVEGMNAPAPPAELDDKIKLFKKTYSQIKSLSSISSMLDYHKLNCSENLDAIVILIKKDFAKLKVESNKKTIKEYLLGDLIDNIIKSKEDSYDFDKEFNDHRKNQERVINEKVKQLNEEDAILKKKKTPTEDELDRMRNIKYELSVLEETKEDLKTYKSKIDNFLTSINDDKLFKSIYDIVNKRESFTYSNFNYVLPFKAEKDITTIELTVTTDKELSCNGPKKLTVKREYWTKKGLKIDFSAGAMINGGNGDFIGNEYENFETDDTNSIIRIKDGGSRALLSIGAFMHIYDRGARNVKLAFSPGISTNEDFDGLIYHLGGSLIFGKKDRLIFTTGLSMKSSKILDKNYSVGEEYETSSLPETPSTIKVFPRLGYFFSLSYNLTSNKSN